MLRMIQEDILVAAGACVAMLPDFYGPDASISMINDALLAIAKGGTAYWPGDPDALRDFLFMPDAGRPLVELAAHKDAFGRRINLPGSGPMQPRLILEAAAQRLSATLSVRGVPLWAIKLAGNFNRKYREFTDIFEIYNNPAYMDGAAAKSLIGDYHKTPYPQAIDRTVRWMTGNVELVAA
jgi:nucleoside-diphosphate-sugar epimerase